MNRRLLLIPYAFALVAFAAPLSASADVPAPVTQADAEACIGAKAGDACHFGSTTGSCTETSSNDCGTYGPTCLLCTSGTTSKHSGCALTNTAPANSAAGWAVAAAFGLLLVGRRRNRRA